MKKEADAGRENRMEEREILLAGAERLTRAASEAGTRSDARSSSMGSNRCQDHAMPRAYWTGYLRLSLVTCPIELFPATSQAEKTHFHQINTQTGHRLRQQMVDEETGRVVDTGHKGRGYELTKGKYVEIEEDELKAIQVESTHTVDIDGFVPRADIDKRYLDKPYYIAPNGKTGAEAFVVIRDAMQDEERVALARIVMTHREHIIMLGASRLHETAGQRIFAVVLAAGDEVLASLEDFIKRENIHAAYFTSIGALSDVVLLYFDWQKKDYQKIPVREQVEVASLIGDVADDLEGKATLHVHVVVGTRDGSAKAGPHVRPTLEVILTESPAHLRKVRDAESGLALIRPLA